MQDEKWNEIIGRIKDDFTVEEHTTEDLDPGPGSVETIIFEGPTGRMKLERTTKPVVLDKKTIGSRRIGSDTTVEYVYSDSEFSKTFKAYQWNDAQNDWVVMEGGGAFRL